MVSLSYQSDFYFSEASTAAARGAHHGGGAHACVPGAGASESRPGVIPDSAPFSKPLAPHPSTGIKDRTPGRAGAMVKWKVTAKGDGRHTHVPGPVCPGSRGQSGGQQLGARGSRVPTGVRRRSPRPPAPRAPRPPGGKDLGLSQGGAAFWAPRPAQVPASHPTSCSPTSLPGGFPCSGRTRRPGSGFGIPRQSGNKSSGVDPASQDGARSVPPSLWASPPHPRSRSSPEPGFSIWPGLVSNRPGDGPYTGPESSGSEAQRRPRGARVRAAGGSGSAAGVRGRLGR